MKKTFAVSLAVLMASACLSAPAQAAGKPVVYDHARAIPTQSGENVRITIYTRNISRVRARIDDSEKLKAVRFGTGCGKLHCAKWKLYAVRLDDECYDLRISGRTDGGSRFKAPKVVTACEPFRGGEV